MTRVALSASSKLALEAGATIAERGGCSVDTAIAAAIAAMVTEPGVCAPGAGGFVSVGGRRTDAEVYDGYMTVPGLGGRHANPSTFEATMEYGGGITTLVGPGSVATPGAWAALGMAHRRHGALPWADLVLPGARLAQDGFPLGGTSRYYLGYSHEVVFGHDPASRAALHPGGTLADVGELITMPDLAASLEAIAERGSDWLYTGDLARSIATDMAERGGLVTIEDLRSYRAVKRAPVAMDLSGYRLASNPAPAVGGAALAGLLDRFLGSSRTTADMIAAQTAIFDWRNRASSTESAREAAVDEILAVIDPIRSPSTIHISAVDESGLACSITLSAGYGSGFIPTGTGMWMNNALGELELVGRDLPHLVPGERLSSNMAPSIAVSETGAVLAIGSPGADRITTALAQTLIAFCVDGRDLLGAVESPRIHVELEPSPRLAAEPGVDLDGVGIPVREFDSIHMFFGGVGAAHLAPDGRLEAIADPRRNGAAAVVG